MENTENTVPVEEISVSLDNTLLVDLNTKAEQILTSSQNIENLLIEQNNNTNSFHSSFLVSAGIIAPFFVLFLLYKFIKLFY